MLKVQASTGHFYDVRITTTSDQTFSYRYMSRSWVAEYLRNARDLDWTIVATHRTRHYETPVEMCGGCQARPAVWTVEADEPYSTADCGQCDWWMCWDMRAQSMGRPTWLSE